MQTRPERPSDVERRAGALRGHAASHAVPVLLMGGATVLGALAAFLYQVISARALGPADFSLLAAFLAILNVAAIASSALQNTVAVRTAEVAAGVDGAHPAPGHGPAARRRPSEATMLGLLGGVLVAASSPVLVRTLDTTVPVVLLAAAAVPLSFWLSEAVGLLQGAGRSIGAVWWTTVSLLARVALLLLSLALGLGIGGVLASALLATGLAVVGATLPARRVPHPGRAVLSRTGVVVLVLSLLSAWLVNADVIVLRATASGEAAGNFASAAILVKASFMLPSTLSVYLLSRFVRNRGNGALMRLGSRLTVGITAAAGVVLALVFSVAGELVGRLVYGGQFDQAGALLLPLSLAYLPWIIAQSVLIRLTASASRPAVAVLLVASLVQAVGFLLAAPDVHAVIAVQGGLGAAVLAAFLVIVGREDRHRPEPGDE